MNRSQLLILSILVIILLGGGVLWSYGRLESARWAADRAAADYLRCQEHAQQIRSLSQAPAVAGQTELQASELASRLESAAESAGVVTERISRISPEPLRRLAETPYKEQVTQVELRELDLRQIVTLLQPLTQGETPLHVRSLRITAPREQNAAGLWNAEVGLTHLIYAPDPSRPGNMR